jgi:hypothetical protein
MQSACAVLHSHLWTVRLYRIFPRYLIKGKIFGTKLLTIKGVSIFSAAFVRNISHSTKNSAIYQHKHTWVLAYSIRYSWRILLKIAFSRNLKKKRISNFMKNPFSGSPAVPCGRTDWQTNTTLTKLDTDSSWQRLLLLVSAGKSLARPGRKQATATEDFDVLISYL